MPEEESDSRPLAGIRVCELSTGIAGPIVTRCLAHFGAEVIKIESPVTPDNHRSTGALWLSPEKHGRGVWGDTRPAINDYNAGKKDVVLDLKKPEGVAAAMRLVERCDVFMCNFRARAIRSLGFDYESVRAIKPDILYLQLTGYGATPAPYADYMAWGKNLSALTGLDDLTGWPDRLPSGITRIAYPDQSNGLHGLFAVLSALDYRERTGEGQYIDLSQFESTVAVLGSLALDFEVNGRCVTRDGNRLPWAVPHGVYPCRGNDSWVAISVFTDDEWKAFCQVAGHLDWTEDARFAGVHNRLASQDVLDSSIEAWTCLHTKDEIAEWLQTAGVPAAPVMDYPGLVVDPQLAARDFWILADSFRFDKDLVTRPPAHLSDTPGFDERAAPAFGEDNEYVLGTLCGYSSEEIEDLIEKGVTRPLAKPEVKLKRPYLPWIRHIMPQLPWPE